MNRGAKVGRLLTLLKSATRAEREEGEAERVAAERRRRAVRRQGRLVAALQSLGVTATRAAVHALRELGRDCSVESRKKYAKLLRKRAQGATRRRANRQPAPIPSPLSAVPSISQTATAAAGEMDMGRIVKRVTEWIEEGNGIGGLPANDNAVPPAVPVTSPASTARKPQPCMLPDDDCDELDGEAGQVRPSGVGGPSHAPTAARRRGSR